MTPPPIHSADLLRLLGSGVRPVGPASGASGAALTPSAPFADILSAARSGGIESGREVRYAKGSIGAADARTLAALSRAADAAEASGATRLLAVSGGRAFTIDLTTREIVGERSSQTTDPAGALFTGVDAVAVLPDDRAESAPVLAPQLRPLPVNLALTRALERGSGAAG